MRKLKPDEVKQVIFEILSDFAQFCDENGLRYYLCGGTLLGAIRHKGFIPWDDDIDILMPRPDYDRLHELFKKNNIRDYYELIGITAGNSFWPFAKIVDLRTFTENKYFVNDKHLWIDIFPMDGLPADKAESDKVLSKAPAMKRWFTRSNARLGEGKGIRKILKIPAVLFAKMIGPERLGKWLDKLARKYNFDSSDYVGDITWSLGPKERFKKEDYLPMIDVEFCGKMFHAPLNWNLYLTQIYGDYMQLPPEEQRKTHEYTVYIRD